MSTTTIEPRMELEQNLHMYRQMAKIRAFEEQVNELYKGAKMPGLAHLYVGEEGVAVGVCEALRRDDFITSTHRGHGHCLAKGASVNRMFAELLGKEPGYCRGKGGSMHIADPETGNLGANAIVGGSAGIATGAALSAKMRGSGQVAVCFFGDGALGQGLLYEAMNMASLWKLPVIYVCENNLYGEYTPCGETIAGDILGRARGFGIHAESVDGQDVQAVNATMRRLVERARRGEGPAFLECKTYRYYGHHVGDVNREYRTKDEEREWMTNHDPLLTLAGRLTGLRLADASVFERIETDVKTEIDSGVQYALAAPYPAAQPGGRRRLRVSNGSVSAPVAGGLDYKWLVQDDRIHASLYTDPRIFADEIERIFHRGWVFVGHDSEIPHPGDFVTRHLGTEPVVMVRGKDGAVAVLVNRCAHRGTMVCTAERGSTRTFTCPYHGWTYDLGGELLGAPYPGGYAALRQEPPRAHPRAARGQLPRLRLRQPVARPASRWPSISAPPPG